MIQIRYSRAGLGSWIKSNSTPEELAVDHPEANSKFLHLMQYELRDQIMRDGLHDYLSR